MSDDGLAPTRRKARILVVVDGEETRTVPIPTKDGSSLTIGRSPTCDVTVDDFSMSRSHARIYGGRHVQIEDLGSSNGTRVRGEKIAPRKRVRLRVGDLIECGDAVLFVHAKPTGPERGPLT